MTTVDYSSGNVEWNESGLTNVTFRRRTDITEVVTMPVYDEEENPVYLTDEEGNSILDEEGNPIPATEIIVNQTVTQDEIPAQVNRLYVYNTYTYIQFVPTTTDTVQDVRPVDLGTPESDGYYEYDKRDYYNDDYHQSFVIENNTGNIYSLENAVYIETINNGLLKIKDSSYVWDCRIKENDELEIFTLFQNAMLGIGKYFKDKYGNNYIQNGSLDEIVPETNTIFFRNHTYSMAVNTGDVVFADGDPGKTYWTAPLTSNAMHIDATRIRIMEANLTSRTITASDYLEFYPDPDITGRSGVEGVFIKNKELYIWGSDNILIVDTDTMAIKHYVECRMDGGIDTNLFYYNMVLPDTVLVRDLYGVRFPAALPADKLFYYQFDFAILPVSDEPYYFDVSVTNYDLSYNGHCQAFGGGLVPLLEGLDERAGDANGPWTKTTLHGRDEYMVVIKEVNGERIPVVIKTSEYIAEDQQTIVLKPINR
jgi:hypothetical protein